MLRPCGRLFFSTRTLSITSRKPSFIHNPPPLPKNITHMSLIDPKFCPPKCNGTMKELDRAFFTRTVEFAVVYFPSARAIGQFVKTCRSDLLTIPTIPHVMKSPTADNPGRKGCVLTHKIDKTENWKNFVSAETVKAISDAEGSVEKLVYTLDYSFWKADEILGAILPLDLCSEIPSGFTVCGHVAHFNLKREYKPWGKILGQVTLDKNAHIRTVVDKVDSIATKFRTFKMQLLAGDDDMLVEQREAGCRFRFDFSSVYWNSRLHTEHERLVALFRPGEAVADVMAGVGPFAVPAGKKGVVVHANDLNPESHKYLVENIELNQVGGLVTPFNEDGRAFIQQSAARLLAATTLKVLAEPVVKKRKTHAVAKTFPGFYSHFVMNLPDSALTFLDAFIGIYANDQERLMALPGFQLPMVHVHCFEKWEHTEVPEPGMEDLHKRVHAKVCALIGFEARFEEFAFHTVRWVAPTKPMFCVSFRLPAEVAFKKSA